MRGIVKQPTTGKSHQNTIPNIITLESNTLNT